MGTEEKEAQIESAMKGGEGEPWLCAHREKADMAPWEQHAAVISLPRYDYSAPSSLLQQSRSGFLITCPIKREKSATKEAISLLGEFTSCSCSSNETSGTNTPAKKMKLSPEANPGTAENAVKDGVNNILEVSAGVHFKGGINLSLMKLSRSGLLLFTFPNNNSRHVVDVLSNIFCSLESGKLKSPLWCHRIFPIQETCVLTEKDLQLVVSRLVEEFFSKDHEKLERPIKFAVGYNRRGVDEMEMKSQKNNRKDTDGSTPLDRETCFKVVAGAVKAVAKNSVVDLKSPEVVVLVELLPISGIPHGSLVVGVSILPLELVTTKPRLCIKSLIADIKATKKSI
ncbi:hypothetical protein Cni_G18525 [Canna indica]|uniref:THUMP domain-containing protein n=1 Tax=Canna indica TaxID=4628 RepID=A0AAQ3KL73_9LILI|nr:hypothetical protein Cni_G18525 [Canna indica]